MIRSQAFQVRRPVYPLAAVFSSVIILLCGFFASMNAKVCAAYIIALCLLYTAFGYWKILWKAFLIFALLGIISASATFFSHKYTTALVSVFRFLILGLSSVTLVSTKAISLTRSLDSIHMPRAITLGMLVTVRFIPILRSETKRIRDAMKTRGVGFSSRTLYRAFLLPFVMQLINFSDILALSVETRGFSLTEKEATVYKEVPFTARDTAYSVLIIAVSAAAVIGKAVFR